MNTSGLVLLTSLFEPSAKIHGHTGELFASVGANLLNPFLAEVHILMESKLKDCCGRLPGMIVKIFAEAARGLAKLRCTKVEKQPTYADFFTFAGRRLAQHVVILSNTDVVFDDTLGLVDLESFRSSTNAFVISVATPPKNGMYKRVLKKDCQRNIGNRCAIGRFDHWQYGGASWDSYVFRAPVPATVNMTNLNFTMNRWNAENHAGAALVLGGLNLSNPCYHVHAYHWHCAVAMHAVGPPWPTKAALGSVLPCRDCAGLTDRVPHLCVNGSRSRLSERLSPSDKYFFTRPNETFVCCPRGQPCSMHDAHVRLKKVGTGFGWCRKSTDVDCLATFSADVQKRVR